MTAPICLVCDSRPTPEGYACTGCAAKATGRLRAIADLAPDARLVAAGLVKRGTDGRGGKHGPQSPGNDDAADAVDAVQNTLTTLARDIAATRGLTVPDARGRDPIVVTARWLLGQVEWLRHAAEGTQPWAPGAYGEIGDCAGRLRGLVNGRSEQRFLGPCGAPVEALDSDAEGGPVVHETGACEGDVYCHLDADHGRCKTCGTKWATAKRQAWLSGEVRSHAFRASEINDAYGVNIKTIRTWHARGQLASHGFDGYDNQGRPRPTFNVGDVLDLAAADAARRETNRAKRARRRAETDERMTA